MSSEKPRGSPKYLDLITALFAVILVTSNVASSAKIVSLGFSVFGVQLAFDGGTLLFPLSYVLGDVQGMKNEEIMGKLLIGTSGYDYSDQCSIWGICRGDSRTGIFLSGYTVISIL